MNKQAFGQRIRQARLEQNFTSDMLAETCELNPVFIRQIECGLRLPSLPNLVVLCNALCVSPDYLLRDDLILSSSNQLEKLMNEIHALSPKQLDMVTSTVMAMIEHLEY